MRYPPSPRRRAALIFQSSPACVAEVKSPLAADGVDLVAADALADAELIDLRPKAIAPRKVTQILTHVRQRAQTAPLIFLVEPDQIGDDAIIRLAETDIVLQAAGSIGPLVRTLKHLVSIADRTDEVALRLRCLGILGLGAIAPPPTPAVDTTLFLGEPSPETLEILGELNCRKTVRAAITRAQALHALELGQADSLVIFVQKQRRRIASLIRLLRRHTELSSLPITIVEPRITKRHAAYWTQVGADAVVTMKDARAAIALSRRGARARDAAKGWDHLLGQSVVTDLGDVSRLASNRFFETCLAARCAPGRPSFALGAIRLDPATGDDHHAAHSEAGVYLALATRRTDLVSRPAPDLFLVALPGCDAGNAAATMGTYSRMVQDLKFGSNDAPMTFSAQTNSVISTPEDTPATLLARLLREMPKPALQSLLDA